MGSGRWTYNDEIASVEKLFGFMLSGNANSWAELGRRVGLRPGRARRILSNPIYKGIWLVDKTAGPARIDAMGRVRRRMVPRVAHQVLLHRVFRERGTPRLPGDTRDEALLDERTWDAVQDMIARTRTH